jgi:glutathione synthase/RimK-type ligase-like ATP-grasp enzyme
MKKKNTFIPLIAVLTEIFDDPPYFRSIHSFCEELHQVSALTNCFFYVTSINHFSSTKVKGFYYEDHEWKQADFPFPHVIYNRVHSRKLEKSEEFLAWKMQMDQLEIPFFNSRFLSKWEIHELLSFQSPFTSHIPETTKYSLNNLNHMISRHPILFLKPIHGSQGRNIVRISTLNTEFQLDISGRTEGPFQFNSLTRLLTFVDKQIANRSYIIQQGIPLLTYENRSLDFRVLCHSNPQESWQVTSTVARVTAQQQFVSNLSHGGEIINPVTALASYFDKDISLQLLTKLKKFAVELAIFLQEKIDGHFAEFGIDIGLDKQGKLWLIEINSKPSKNFPSETLNIRPSAKAIIKYCKWLIEKNMNNGHPI